MSNDTERVHPEFENDDLAPQMGQDPEAPRYDAPADGENYTLPTVATGGGHDEPPLNALGGAPAITRPSARRRPRFVERPRPTDAVAVNRRDLLAATQRGNDKPQLTRERVISGNIPSWDPLPPGEMAVRRR